MENPLAIFPIWVIAIDYVLGIVMWRNSRAAKKEEG